MYSSWASTWVLQRACSLHPSTINGPLSPKLLRCDACNRLIHIDRSRLNINHSSLLEPRHKLPPLHIPRNPFRIPLIIKINIQHHPAPTLRPLPQFRQPAQLVLDPRTPQTEILEVVRITALPNDKSNGVDFSRSYGGQDRKEIVVVASEPDGQRDVPQLGQRRKQRIGDPGPGDFETSCQHDIAEGDTRYSQMIRLINWTDSKELPQVSKNRSSGAKFSTVTRPNANFR